MLTAHFFTPDLLHHLAIGLTIAIGSIGLGLDLIMQRAGKIEWTIWWKVAH